MTRPGYATGFTTLEAEVELDSLEIEGSIPEWLGGTLLRNGPGRFEAGETPLRHWFDGLAMLHRFSFEGGRVSYANRFLRTDAYRAAERGDLSFEEFATGPPRSIFRRAAAMLKPEFSDNCSFGVAGLGGETIAVTETPVSIAFDPETLETGDYAYSPPGQHAVAHLHRDPGSGELLGLATQFGARSKYRVYAQKDRESQRILAEMPVCEPSYMHSFGMSERHFLVTACPFVASPLQLGLSGKPFIENFRWEPERGTRFLVADRETGKSRGEFEAGAFFAFHHVNVFERGSELVADLVVYDDPGMIDALYLDRLRSRAPSEAVHGRLNRYRIDLDGGGVVEEELCTRMFELPQIDYGRHNGRPYRFVYGAAIDTDTGEEPSDFTDQVIKVDVETGEFATWQSPGSYPGEPVFVPSPRGRAEDEGVLLSVVLDVRAASSYLLVLDAATLTELGRARVPHHIPFGFHGQYFE